MKTRLVMIITGLALLTGGCGKKVTPPGPDPKPVPYNIYAAAMNPGVHPTERYGQFYIYDADSLTLLDTIPLPDHLMAWTAVVSSDGRWLYAACNRQIAPPGGFIVKIDLNAHTVAWIQPTVNNWADERIRLLEDEQLLLGLPDVHDAVTGVFLHRLEHVGSTAWKPSGPLVGEEVAGITTDSATGGLSVIQAVNVLTGQFRGRFVARVGEEEHYLALNEAALHPDGRRVLAVGNRPWLGAWFVVGDLITGEVLFTHELSHEWSELDINQDGTLAAVAVSANWFFGIGSPAVYVFDLTEYRLIKRFGSQEIYEIPGQARFLPGRNRVAALADAGGTGWVQVFDLETLGLPEYIPRPFHNMQVGALAVGPRPAL